MSTIARIDDLVDPILGEPRLLQGKRLLITGVITSHSLAFAIAARAQEFGAQVVLTGFGRTRRITQLAAQDLPVPAPVIELDVNNEADVEHLAPALEQLVGGVDGALHAIAHAPLHALSDLLGTTPDEALGTFRTSAYSLKVLVEGLMPVLAPGASIVALDFTPPIAWRNYTWMGVAKAGLRTIAQMLNAELGERGTRVNLITAGPIQTSAAEGVPRFPEVAAAWEEHAPLGWDSRDPGPIADTACFLLSDLARGIGGANVPVDGGVHALGMPLPATPPPIDKES